MRRRLLVLLAALPVAVLLVVQGHAEAGNGADTLAVETADLNDPLVPRFAFAVVDSPCLSDTVVEVPGATIADLQLNDPNSGMFTLPGAAPGIYEVIVTCTTDSGTEHGRGEIDFGYVVIEKVVTGDVPADAFFVVELDCDAGVFSPSEGSYAGESGEGFGPPAIDFKVDFGPEGGERTLVHYRSQDCTIEETETAGAQQVTVETEDCLGDIIPGAASEATTGSFFIDAPVTCTQVVTNEFGTPDVEPDDDLPELPDVVEATPTFTG